MTDYTELKRLAQRIVDVQTSQDEPISKLFDEFEAAASPEAVLALIAENERLRADYASLATFNPDWDRVAAAQDTVREHMELANQLRAENAGLRTGYEAYERVNAELRNTLAECATSLDGEMLQKYHGQKPDDMHPVTRHDYDRDMAELAGYRAAMNKEADHD
ncbi:hypothetical protein D3C81_1792710 [compost metagenome]